MNAACEETIEEVFAGIEPYWPPERDIVDDHYQSITLPVAEFPAAAFRMSATWRRLAMILQHLWKMNCSRTGARALVRSAGR